MQAESIVDDINRGTMRKAVEEYSLGSALTRAEEAALAAIGDSYRGKRILDVGVGAGRTVPALRALSEDYVGIDYVPEMIERCRQRFPGVRFEVADARNLACFADQSFDLIVFACNGIAMVSHEGRLAILREIRRLLAPGGHFLFSTYNRNNQQHTRFLTLPDFDMTWNPVRFLVRAVRVGAHTVYALLNRIRYSRYEVHTGEYSLVNDRCHDYATMLYYIYPMQQFKQLRAHGFERTPLVFDLNGQPADVSSTDDSLTYAVAG